MRRLMPALLLLGMLPMLSACANDMVAPNPTTTSGAAANSQVGKVNEKSDRTKDPTTPIAPP